MYISGPCKNVKGNEVACHFNSQLTIFKAHNNINFCLAYMYR